MCVTFISGFSNLCLRRLFFYIVAVYRWKSRPMGNEEPKNINIFGELTANHQTTQTTSRTGTSYCL